MASQYTQNYQLCQWHGSDQVKRTDFNEDNAKIDAALAALAADKLGPAHLEAINNQLSQLSTRITQNASGLSQVSGSLTQTAATIPKVAVGTYTGDGAASRTIALSFTPKAVLVLTEDGRINYDDGHQFYYGGLALTGLPAQLNYNGVYHNIVQVTANGFEVYYNEIYMKNWHIIVESNLASTVFRYFAIG